MDYAASSCIKIIIALPFADQTNRGTVLINTIVSLAEY